ncbi:MAG: SUMF1/EgtB/PvdO family nonheme iron enzyme [Chloroflexi bacterium]|nr:SUMF1/EgtB/PvdO family nonheme iron enzyme [Chloroflexota bacterium]
MAPKAGLILGGIFPPTPDYCNFNNLESGPTPVGQYSPKGDSPYGCVDMSGNVAEWVLSETSRIGRILRGGSYQSNAKQVSGTARFSSTLSYAPDIRYDDVGFRCVTILTET